MKSVLGSEESSWSDIYSFTTTATCEKPTLSYVTNSNTAHTGSVSWTGNADNYELLYSTSYSFEPGDEGVTQINLGNVNSYTLQDLAPETTYRVKVRANCGEEDGYSQWSNQVSFTTLATCVAPSGLSATANASTITLSWSAGTEGQDAWDIRYKTNSDSDYTYVHLDNQPTTSYTITGLNPVTAYNLNVRAYCSEDDQSKWGASTNQSYDLSITTECGALSLPYTYGFEDNLNTASPYSSSYPFPNCWNRIVYQSGYYGSYTYYPYVFTATTSQPYAHGGNGANSYSGHCLRFYQTSGSTNECAVLPEISSDYEISRIQIRFWAAVQSSQGTLSVGVMENPTVASTFTSIQEVTVSNTYSNGFQEFTIPFSSYNGDGRYIALMCGTGNSYAYFLIDDITVEVVPSCLVPENLTADEITENEAVLTWTPLGNETEWNLQYKRGIDSDWSELVTVEETSFTLTGLQRATVYEVRVQANCAIDDQSDWSNPITFETECGIWPIDAENTLIENFDDESYSFPPACWTTQPSYNGWGVSFNNAMVNDQPEPHGAAHSGTMSNGWVFLILPPMHINGNAMLSFDQLFGSVGTATECSIAVTSLNGTFDEFTPTIWTADESERPGIRSSVSVSLADYDGQDIQVAFKYEGNGTESRTWYIDNVKVRVTTNQTVELAQGSNWFSANVEITLDDLKEALLEAVPDTEITIQSQGNNTKYNPNTQRWTGRLTSLDLGHMYKISVDTSCEITLEGMRIDPAEHPVTISNGVNWIAFPLNESMSLTDAFTGFAQPNDKVQSQSNNASYNGTRWNGRLTTLMPGNGYIYESGQSEDRILIIHRSTE